MTINFSVPHDENELKPRITVVGVGGAGGNAVNNMIRSNLEGVEFIVTNTDSQSLTQSLADRRLQLGPTVTQGLGAGSRPDVGKAAAEEAMEDLITELGDSNMVFITAGMGGGTGTGAAPVIAQAARERGILTVGVITKPFHFEGAHRMRTAEQGIEELSQYVDTLIIIPNQNLFRIANEKTTFADAFHLADNVLHQGVRGVTDLMVMPGLINLDFADIRTVMSEMGKAMMGTGEAEGEKRAIEAAESAISNPLLDDMSMKGARGVLINITGGMDMTLFEVDEAANRIREEVDSDANIIFGSTFDEKLDGMMRVSVVATGIAAEGLAAKPRPQMTLVSNRPKQAPVAEEAPSAQTITMTMESEPEAEPMVLQRTGTDDAPLSVDVMSTSLNLTEDKLAATVEITRQMAGRSSETAETFGTSADFMVAESTMLEASTAEAPASPAPVEGVQASAVRASVAETIAARTAAPAPAPITPVISRTVADPFVAPPPAVPVTKAAVEPTESVDPFNAAAMANASGGAKGPSLFQRVTGMGRKTREDVEPRADLLEPSPAMTAGHAPTTQPEPASDPAKLGSPDRADRVTPSSVEDDLLDIPAFLRRQAN
jgi:cell division protein FtsZ